MRFTPILIIYIILLAIAGIAVKQLNKCTVELDAVKKRIHLQEKK